LPFKRRSEVVADCPAAGCVNASYEERKSTPAVAAMSAPPVVVRTSAPLGIEETAKEVVVACDVVAWSAVKFWSVVEAVARMFCA
jgi:hypothetical protein